MLIFFLLEVFECMTKENNSLFFYEMIAFMLCGDRIEWQLNLNGSSLDIQASKANSGNV